MIILNHSFTASILVYFLKEGKKGQACPHPSLCHSLLTFCHSLTHFKDRHCVILTFFNLTDVHVVERRDNLHEQEPLNGGGRCGSFHLSTTWT